MMGSDDDYSTEKFLSPGVDQMMWKVVLSQHGLWGKSQHCKC